MKKNNAKKIKIGVFRALNLGDMICSLPAFRALRVQYPKARIALIGLLWQKNFAERFKNYFDEFIYFPGLPGLPEQPFLPSKTLLFLKKMRKKNFDLFLQMHGKGRIINHFLMFFPAKNYAGFSCPGNFVPQGVFPVYPEKGTETERMLYLMKRLRIKPQGKELEWPIFKKDCQDFKKLNLLLEKKNYICLHPGANAKIRRWRPDHFAKLGDLAAKRGYKVVITGVENEKGVANSVLKKMRFPAINLAGKTSLGALGVLLKNSKMLVSNDTGVSHLAQALKVKSLIISLSEDQERWRPQNKKRHIFINGYEKEAFLKAQKTLKKELRN